MESKVMTGTVVTTQLAFPAVIKRPSVWPLGWDVNEVHAFCSGLAELQTLTAKWRERRIERLFFGKGGLSVG